MQCDKNMHLVKTIEKYPCLYNSNILDYQKKDVADEAWNEVAKKTQLSVTECKEKWKNLRYGLLRSLRLNPDGTFKKKYYLHDEMEFVLPFIKTLKHETIIQAPEELGFEISVERIEDDKDLAVHPQDKDLEISESPKKRSRPNDTIIKNVQNNSGHYYSMCDDSRKMFLLSLLPEVNTLTEFQMRVFRRKVLTLLDEISDDDRLNQYGTCLLEWQDSGISLQNDKLIKKEPLYVHFVFLYIHNCCYIHIFT